MLDSIYHMTLRLLGNLISSVKRYIFVIMYATMLWTCGLSTHNTCLVCFAALRSKSAAMVMAGRSVHLTEAFPGQTTSTSCTYFRL